MNKLKRFTKICGLIFLVSTVALLILLPFGINSMVDLYNEIVTQKIEYTYKESSYDKSIKNITVESYNYIRVEKSPDECIHVKVLNGRMRDIISVVDVNDDRADFYFSEGNLKTLSRENLLTAINIEINNPPHIIFYLPEDVNVVTNGAIMYNPYTKKEYPSMSDYVYEERNPVPKEEVDVENNLNPNESINNSLIELDLLKQSLDNVMNDEISNNEYKSMLESNYKDILQERLNIVRQIYNIHPDESEYFEMQTLVENLTSIELYRDISIIKLREKTAQYNDNKISEEEYQKEVSDKNQIENFSEKEISLLNSIFQRYLNEYHPIPNK